MKTLKSYVGGRWVEGTGTASNLVNPSTEEVVAQTSTGGIDFKEALAFARKSGAHLRKLTFAQRGEILRKLAAAGQAGREELIALAVENGGNTRGDAKFDVDGAIGTLNAYADLAGTLGDKRVLADGEGVALGRGARLFGQHAWLPREGVAVHVNAFNFPAWGMAEKLAVAFLAGMPVITKPATATALVAHRLAEMWVASGALPEGTFTFVCGGTGDLLEQLGGQDVLAFTGGSDTATSLRGYKNMLKDSVHVNVEADSLNAAILGPDVEPGSEVFNLFVADVARDMTQKTGQKCTAIRRVFVPASRVEEVKEALVERLSAIRVGNPADEKVTMGPVSTAAQLRDVRAGIEKLSQGAKVLLGGASAVNGIGAPEGKGFFVAPTLLLSTDPKPSDAVHAHEVFGPVATLIPFEQTSSMVELVRAANGGLVSSVYSDDKEFLAETVLGIAPFHGRVCIVGEKVAGQTLPPGMVLPQLLHGGPGRAGGGEELGGVRGMQLYMQRVALQGNRSTLEALLK